MSKTKTSWTLRQKGRNHYVRFSHGGQRHEIPTGTSDLATAKERAVQLYADVVSGRRPSHDSAPLKADTQLLDIAAEWIANTESEVSPQTHNHRLGCVGTHLAPFFGTLDNVTNATCAGYVRERLKKVKKETVKKELSVLRGFLDWCVEQGFLDEAPTVSSPKRNMLGTPHPVRRRKEATPITEEEANAIIARLPVLSESRKTEPFAVRARVRFAFETGLRPATVAGLRVPEHYTPGSEMLKITDEIDKNRYGRELPLSEAAREALDSVCPEKCLIFGKHDMRDQLRKAAKGILDDERLRRFTIYDLRTLRATLLAAGGDLPATAYLMGWKQVTTANIYAKPTQRAAARLLRRERTGETNWGSLAAGETPLPHQIHKPRRKTECEGEDSTGTGKVQLAGAFQ